MMAVDPSQTIGMSLLFRCCQHSAGSYELRVAQLIVDLLLQYKPNYKYVPASLSSSLLCQEADPLTKWPVT